MPLPRTRFRLLPALLAATLLPSSWSLLLALAPSARADIQAPPGRGGRGRNEPALTARERPANAVDTSVQVSLGGSAEVTLRARGQLGKNVDFLLRDPPLHGTLSEPRPTGRDTAVVTYTHRADDGAGADGFTYAVQASGTAVSAAATVGVRVTDEPPRVIIVGAGEGAVDLDFGAAPPGGETRRELTLENRGGGVAVGTVDPPPPWTLEGGPGAASYRLGRDEQQTFTFVFRPGAARTFAGRVALGPGSNQVARLLGMGLRADGSMPPAGNVPPTPEAEGSKPPGGRDRGPAAIAGVIGAPAPAASAVAGGPGANPGVVATSSRAPMDREQGANDLPAAGQDAPSLPFPPLATGRASREESPIKKLELQARGPHTLTVSWPVPRPAPASYRVELRRFWIDEDKTLKSSWSAHAAVAVAAPDADGRVQATLRALPAGINQTMRVVAVDGRGGLSEPSAPIQAATLPARRWWEFITLGRVLVAGLAVCLFLVWRRWRREREPAVMSGW